MRSIVFSDLDGTLINSAYEITPKTLEAIRTLQEQEFPFVVVSARSPMGIESVIKAYGIRCPILRIYQSLKLAYTVIFARMILFLLSFGYHTFSGLSVSQSS